MENQEEFILEKLSSIVQHSKDIAEYEPALGEILLFAVKSSMDLYESIVKNERYSINDTVDFVARMQGISVQDLLIESYPTTSSNTLPKADEDLTSFILNSTSVYEPDIDEYKQTVSNLVQDFKNTVEKIRKDDTTKLPGERMEV